VPSIETVRGPVEAAALGVTLPHEHIFILRPEMEQNLRHHWGAPFWDEDLRVADAIEKLSTARAGGIKTIVDPTVLGLGRYFPRIQRVNAGVDMHILVATGLYAFLELSDFLATRSDDVIVDIFVRGVIAHAGDSNDLDYLRTLADRGASLGCDRYGIEHFNPTPDRIRTLVALIGEGYTDRIHLAHDGACFYDFMAANPVFADEHPDLLRIHKSLLPALRQAGVTERQIDQMMVDNPRDFFSPR
jgi:predicted metal-dependent phosphotriesterase family hydrolase